MISSVFPFFSQGLEGFGKDTTSSQIWWFSVPFSKEAKKIRDVTLGNCWRLEVTFESLSVSRN